MVKFSLMPHEEQFYTLFENSARNVVKAAQTLKELMDNWRDVKEKVAEIAKLEAEGDAITHQIIAQLHRTFVTPFDREDIAQLAMALDDVVDFIDSSADAMLLYKIVESTQRSRELADLIVQATEEMAKAIPLLRNKGELKKMLTCCIEVNRVENVTDEVYRSAIAELFDNTKDLVMVIKWREIYEHLESATDRCEDVSNVLEGVALKYG
jgi:uncharacterized protein